MNLTPSYQLDHRSFFMNVMYYFHYRYYLFYWLKDQLMWKVKSLHSPLLLQANANSIKLLYEKQFSLWVTLSYVSMCHLSHYTSCSYFIARHDIVMYIEKLYACLVIFMSSYSFSHFLIIKICCPK